jgi:uncharacterized protein (TIGR00255 family)
MTLSSMTGFARSSGQFGSATWAWELKSVNAKGLDVRLRLPLGLDGLDGEARRMLGSVIVRGTVQATLDLARIREAPDIRINEVLALRMLRQLSALAKAEGLPPPDVAAVLGIKGVVEAPDEAEAMPDDLLSALQGALEDAIVALVVARQSEGVAIGAVLRAKVRDMAHRLSAADDLPSRGVDAVRDRLRKQVEDLLGAAGGQLDSPRLYQEAVLLAVKADIREELDRLKAHLAQAEELLARGGPVGRRLDFLSQELSREVNTLCAKSNDVALTAIGLDLKGLVEQFREQVQNVE